MASFFWKEHQDSLGEDLPQLAASLLRRYKQEIQARLTLIFLSFFQEFES
jgi:hypothetical protein